MWKKKNAVAIYYNGRLLSSGSRGTRSFFFFSFYSEIVFDRFFFFLFFCFFVTRFRNETIRQNARLEFLLCLFRGRLRKRRI